MNPFNLNDDSDYQRWKEQKIKYYPRSLQDCVIEIKNPYYLSAAEKKAMLDLIRRCNFVIYASPLGERADKQIVHQLGQQFGLYHLDHNLNADQDAITALSPADQPPKQYYIPYTHRPIAWHTDGYYNALDKQVYGLILHCVRPAEQGGENELLDHEMIYIQLRDQNPDHIRALQSKVMTIPPNIIENQMIRDAAHGPVFMYRNGHLHMRYTHRKRNIEWSDDAKTSAARQALNQLLQPNNPYYFKGRLESGQGLIANNILHTRSGFEPNSRRLLYRARYYDRIED